MGALTADRRGWGDTPQPANWNLRSQIADAIREQDSRARMLVGERLGTIFSEKSEKGPIRSGVALRVGLDAFEEQAEQLVAGLVRAVSQLAQDSGAFALVEECVHKFLAFLDGELDRILEKVEYEIQDVRKLKGVSHASERIWSQKRAAILEKLEEHRPAFRMPLADVPAVIPLAVAEPDNGPTPVPQLDNVPAPVPHFDNLRTPDPQPEGDRTPFADHWHEMWADMAIRLCTGKLQPGDEDDVCRAMTEWFESRDIAHGESEVRECAHRLRLKFVTAQRISSCIKLSVRHELGDQAAARLNRLADRPGPGTYSGFANARDHWHGARKLVSCMTLVRPDGAYCDDGPDAAGFDQGYVVGPCAERSVGVTAPALAFD